MKQIRSRVTATVLATALLAAASWLLAGPESPSAPSAAAQETAPAAAPAEQPDLPDFEPSEKLPADSAVAFPTDI